MKAYGARIATLIFLFVFMLSFVKALDLASVAQYKRQPASSDTALQMALDSLQQSGRASCNPNEAYNFLMTRAVGPLKIKPRYVTGKYIDGIDPEFACRLARFLKDYPQFKIKSAYRSVAKQRAICGSGRRGCAPPGGSCHNYGLAVDLKPSMSKAKWNPILAKYKLNVPPDYPLPAVGHVQCIEHQHAGPGKGKIYKNGCSTPCTPGGPAISPYGSGTYANDTPFFTQQRANNTPSFGVGATYPNTQYSSASYEPVQYDYNYEQKELSIEEIEGVEQIGDLNLNYDGEAYNNFDESYMYETDPIFSNNEISIQGTQTILSVNDSNKFNIAEENNEGMQIASDSINANDASYASFVPTKGTFGVLDIVTPYYKNDAYVRQNQAQESAENNSDISYTSTNFQFLIHKGDGKINTSVYNEVAPAIYPNRSEETNYTQRNGYNYYNAQKIENTKSLYRQVTNSAFDVFLNTLVPGFSAFSNLISI